MAATEKNGENHSKSGDSLSTDDPSHEHDDGASDSSFSSSWSDEDDLESGCGRAPPDSLLHASSSFGSKKTMPADPLLGKATGPGQSSGETTAQQQPGSDGTASSISSNEDPAKAEVKSIGWLGGCYDCLTKTVGCSEAPLNLMWAF